MQWACEVLWVPLPTAPPRKPHRPHWPQPWPHRGFPRCILSHTGPSWFPLVCTSIDRGGSQVSFVLNYTTIIRGLVLLLLLCYSRVTIQPTTHTGNISQHCITTFGCSAFFSAAEPPSKPRDPLNLTGKWTPNVTFVPARPQEVVQAAEEVVGPVARCLLQRAAQR